MGIGAGLAGLLAIGRIADAGFAVVLARAFDPVFDAPFLGDAVDFVRTQAGLPGAVGAVVLAVVLLGGVVALSALAAVRLAGVVERHRGASIRITAALGAVWLAAAALGSPVAARSVVADAAGRVGQVDAGLRDRAVFAAQTRVDAFAGVPSDQLLAGLHGKDVVVAFVESYGRSALESPDLAPRIVPALDADTRRLTAAGFSARSGWLTSPTFGGGSWFAHATLLSGLWVDNQQRYRSVVGSDRFTLTGAFHRAGWRTVGWEPGVTRAWPEGRFYDYDSIVDSRAMGYRGPSFGWAPMPDEYALSSLGRAEFGPGHRPGAGRDPPGLQPCAVGAAARVGALERGGRRFGLRPHARRGSAAGPGVAGRGAGARRVRAVDRLLDGPARVVRRALPQRRPRDRGSGRPPAGFDRERSGREPGRPGDDRRQGPGGAGPGGELGLGRRPAARTGRAGVADGRLPRPVPHGLRFDGRRGRAAAASQATSRPKDQTRATSATTTAGTTTARGRRSATATVRTTP